MPVRHLIFAVCITMIWAGNFVASKYGMMHFSPFLLSSLRFWATGLALTPFVGLPAKHEWKGIFVLSLVLCCGHLAFAILGMAHGLDIATTVITIQLGTPFACALGAIFFNDKLGPWRTGGLVIAFLGIFLVVGTPNVSANYHGFLMVLFSALMFGLANLCMKRYGGLPILKLVGWMSLMAGPEILLVSLTLEHGQWVQMHDIPLSGFLSVGYSAFVSTIFGYGGWYYLLGKHPVSHVTPFSLLVPVFGIIGGAMIFGEKVGALTLAGGAGNAGRRRHHHCPSPAHGGAWPIDKKGVGARYGFALSLGRFIFFTSDSFMHLRHIALAALVAALWASDFIIGKFGVDTLHPYLFTMLRFLTVGLVLTPFVPMPQGRQWRHLLELSVVLGTLHFTFLFKALSTDLDIPTQVILGQLSTPFACVLGALFFRDRLGAWRTLGMLVAFTGIMLVVGRPHMGEQVQGMVLVLLTALMFAIANLIMKRTEGINHMTTVAWMSLMAAPQILVISLIFESGQWNTLTGAPIAAFGCVLYSALFATIAAYSIWHALLARYTVTQVVPFGLPRADFRDAGGCAGTRSGCGWLYRHRRIGDHCRGGRYHPSQTPLAGTPTRTTRPLGRCRARLHSPSPNFDRRGGVPVSILVLHYTGMQSGAEALARLCDSASKVSAHYVVEEDGGVYALVAEEHRAWHAGVSSWHGETRVNAASIGIEIVNPGHEFGYRPFPRVQVEAVIALCRDILSRHEIPARNVVGHSDVAPMRKEDPGELFPWAWLAAQGVGLWPSFFVRAAGDGSLA